MKVIPKHKTRKLWLLRWDKVKESPWVWGIMLVCLVVPIFCHCEYINNICYGYIAGFIFYVLSQFLPETRKELEAKMRILSGIEHILLYTKALEEQLLGARYVENKNDDFVLASSMVNESICRIDFVEKCQKMLLSLQEDAVIYINLCYQRVQEHVKEVTITEAKWIDPKLNWAINLINDYLMLNKSINMGSTITVNGGELASSCKDFYTGKVVLERSIVELRKYDYFEEEQ